MSVRFERGFQADPSGSGLVRAEIPDGSLSAGFVSARDFRRPSRRRVGSGTIPGESLGAGFGSAGNLGRVPGSRVRFSGRSWAISWSAVRFGGRSWVSSSPPGPVRLEISSECLARGPGFARNLKSLPWRRGRFRSVSEETYQTPGSLPITIRVRA